MRETGAGAPLRGFAFAASFLTTVPVRTGKQGESDLGATAVWFPLVGAAIGAFAGGVRVAAAPLVGASVASVLALIALVAVTGALHQDGLADTADGLGIRGDRERRLAVMRDSAVGAFGVLALVGWALLLITALAALDDAEALLALVAAATLARWAALAHAAAAPAARADGLGAGFAPAQTPLAIATATAVAIAGLACGPLPGLAAIGGALLAITLVTFWSRRSLGGRTGDTLGATVALAEALVVLALVACWSG